MADIATRLPKEKLVNGLASLSFKEIKEIVDTLIQKKLFQPPKAKGIYEKASKITKTRKLSPETALEAVKWSRAKKS
jgi:hypothetical protein